MVIKYDIKVKNILSSRNAYKKLGKDPSRYRLSSESLVKRVVKGNDLYIVNNIVDINNLNRIRMGLNTDTITPNVLNDSVNLNPNNANNICRRYR